MYPKSVSSELYSTIKELMRIPELKDFNLGGGTNLAIKYDYRVSVDIDLFSTKVVGVKQMRKIEKVLKDSFTSKNNEFVIKNPTIENLSMIKGYIHKDGVDINIDVIQNVPLSHSIEVEDDIRLIHDLDIGALKLLAVVGRGNRKDFIDLYVLERKYGFEKIYNELMSRQEKFQGKEYENIFNVPTGKPIPTLKHSLTPLCDFTNANLHQYNKVILTNPKLKTLAWIDISNKWKKVVSDFAKNNGLNFEVTQKRRGFRG